MCLTKSDILHTLTASPFAVLFIVILGRHTVRGGRSCQATAKPNPGEASLPAARCSDSVGL